MTINFCPLASGSSGNNIYVGTEHTHILFDAGLTGKCIEQRLGEMGVSGHEIDALFITHEHLDHIKGAGIISRRFNIPIYATQGTWDAMEKDLGNIARSNKKYIYTGENCVVNDISINPFNIPHDAAEPVGYNIFVGNNKVSIATDLGHITDEIKQSIVDSDILLLESNYDLDMLRNGSYPFYLKKRISGDKGHLCNDLAGETLVDIMSEKLKYVYLGHLSDENNTPHKAFDTVAAILENNNIKIGKDVFMDLATRYSKSVAVQI